MRYLIKQYDKNCECKGQFMVDDLVAFSNGLGEKWWHYCAKRDGKSLYRIEYRCYESMESYMDGIAAKRYVAYREGTELFNLYSGKRK